MKPVRVCLVLLACTASVHVHAEDFVLTSVELEDGGMLAERFVHDGFGCSGQNISPQLSWRGAPDGTQSFALTVFDPDAQGGNGWWHWIVANIPPTSFMLPDGAGNDAARLPPGAVQALGDYGTAGWEGPCPPPGAAHRYEFTLWALDVPQLPVDAATGGAQVAMLLREHALDRAQLTATYAR